MQSVYFIMDENRMEMGERLLMESKQKQAKDRDKKYQRVQNARNSLRTEQPQKEPQREQPREGKSWKGQPREGRFGKEQPQKKQSWKEQSRKERPGKEQSREERLRKGRSREEQPEKEQPRKERESSLCPVFDRCGGCQLLDMPYEEQLKKKQKAVEGFLKGLCRVEKITGMEQPFHYRNKVHAVFGYRKGKPISGVYREGTHEIAPVKTCMIEDEKADEIIGTIRSLLTSFKIKTYDEDTGYGLLRHVLVKRGFSTGQIMVVLVTTSPVFPSRNNFVRALRERHPEITTIIQNQNDRATSMVLGDKERVLYGKGYIEDELCGCRFRISSKSFYQVNPVQTEKLYRKAMELAGLTGKETVIDAYCGIGTIGMTASSRAKKVIGVELNPDAVRDAVANAKRNQVTNIQFYQNDAGRFMTGMAEQGEHADVVFMDPPRSGSTEEFIQAAAELGPERVVYVSCNPETLARDLKVFQRYGYRAGEAWPYDLFPHTEHTEVICFLSKLNAR